MNTQTILNSIRAATAWKEHAHRLSNNSLDRLKQSGILQENIILKSLRGIHKGTGIKYVRNIKSDRLHETSYYVPSKSQLLNEQNILEDNTRYKKVSKMYGKNNLGKISINKANTDKSIKEESTYSNKKINNNLIYDVLHHEHIEATTPKQSKKDLEFLKEYGHNNIGVIMKERKHYNQTGGNYYRGQGKELTLKDLRDINYENDLIDTWLPGKIRLKNKDYKEAIRNYLRKVRND